MTPFPIALESSIDTSTPDFDVSPFNPEEGKAPHTKNNGIERNGGIKNAYYRKYTKAANVAIQYTKSGKRVEYVESTGEIKVDGTVLDTVGSKYGIKSLTEAPGAFDDVMAQTSSGDNALVGLKVGATTSRLEYWSIVNGTYVKTALYDVTVPIGATTYQTMRIVRPYVPGIPSTVLYLIAQRYNYQIDIWDITAGAILFSITGLTGLGEFCGYNTLTAGETRIFIVQTDTPNAWTWTSTGTVLTALAGYGYPHVTEGIAGVWWLSLFRAPTTSAVVGKKLDMRTTTTFTDIQLSGTPTAIHYARNIYGGLFVSYTTGAADSTEVAQFDLTNGFEMEVVNAARSYLTEIVGALGDVSALHAAVYSINGIASYIGSLSQTSGLISGYGPLYSEVGSLDATYFPHSRQQNIAYRSPSGNFFILSGALTGIPTRLQLIDDEVVLINTEDSRNIIDAERMLLTTGPNAYNGAMVVAAPSASPGVPMLISAQYKNKYGGGVDTGEKTITGVGTLAATWLYPYARALYPQADIRIDVYKDSIYYGSALTGGYLGLAYNISRSTDKIDSVYVQDLIIPAPSASLISEGGFEIINKTFFREKSYSGYLIGNEIKYPAIAFSLFGTRYVFDGEDIFIASFSAGGLLQSIDRVAIASGLTLLCATPIEAWFLSAWDNSLWTFNGGKNVEKVIRCNAKDTILGGAYCGAANEILFYEGSGKSLYLRDGVMTESTLPVTAAGALSLQPDTFGTWIVPQGGAGDICQLVHNSTGATILPLDFQTAYQGPGLARKATIEEYVLTLYDPAKTAGVVTLEFNGFDEAGAHTVETHNITVTALYDAGGYLRLSCVPVRGQVIGGSIRVSTSLPITIIDATARIGDNLAVTVFKNR